MCLIIVCPKNTDKYSDLVLNGIRTASETNTDGIGFAYKRNSDPNNIYIDKGFSTAEDFIKEYKAHKLAKRDEVIIHLRIGNKGAKNADMNHPFVISDKEEVILSRKKKVDLPVLAHNGTFHAFAKTNDAKSDTYYFIEEMMSYKYIQAFLLEDTEGFTKLFKNTISTNKLAILFPGNEEGIVIGDFVKDSGYLFSNVSYKESRYRNVGGYEEYDYSYSDAYKRSNNFPAKPNTVHLAGDTDIKVFETHDSIKSGYTSRSVFKHTEFLWVPYAFQSTQFNESIFIPAVFNYKHFEYTAQRTVTKLGLLYLKKYKIEIFDEDKEENNPRYCHVLTQKYGDSTDWTIKAFCNNVDLIESCYVDIVSEWKNKYQEFFKLIKSYQNITIDKELYYEIKTVLDTPSKINTCDFRNDRCLWIDTLKLWFNYLTITKFAEYKEELYKVQEEDEVKNHVDNSIVD